MLNHNHDNPDGGAAVNAIRKDLLALGVRPGGRLLVHASLRALGPVPGGAETVVRGLLSALGPDGTLLMPALSYLTVDFTDPVFDIRKTPSCVGALPEYFRTRAGTKRSLHLTHSVCAVGPEAEALLADHYKDGTPCGPRSAFGRLYEHGGQFLFLGCGLTACTCMHAVEETVRPPYLLSKSIDYTAILEDGTTLKATTRLHDFEGWSQRYDRLESMLDGTTFRTARVLEAHTHLLECKPFWETAAAALRDNPFQFVEKREA